MSMIKLWMMAVLVSGCLLLQIASAEMPDQEANKIELVRAERDIAEPTLKQLNAELEAAQKVIKQLCEERDALLARIAELESKTDTNGGSIDRLRAELEAAIASAHRDRVTLAYNIGCIYMTARQYDRAEQAFKRALQLAPDDPSTHFNLGILYDEHLEAPEKARRHYERFVELAPDDPDVARVKQWLILL